MINHYIALMKREFWEHRSIWVTPLAIASVISLGTLTALVFAGGFAQELDVAIFGAQNIAGDTERRAMLTGFFAGPTPLFALGLGILTIFYALDSLYAERKNKSILFWRSLPVTDAETVISKLATAALLIPAVTIVAVIATHIVNLVVLSIWVSMQGGSAGTLVWSSAAFLDNWLAAILVTYGFVIWMSPFLGWFLFVSAWTKRSPLLIAFLPLALIPMVEGIFFRSAYFAEAVWGRLPQIPLFSGVDIEAMFENDSMHMDADMISLLAPLDFVKFFTDIDTWIGVVVCGLLTTAAIYVRRYRDES
ncbi:MAG: ABC-2 transporter permease [Woeseiaceae bacterium]|nr:ABC-2 transporter permease [Woeseiaceae bacterium]